MSYNLARKFLLHAFHVFAEIKMATKPTGAGTDTRHRVVKAKAGSKSLVSTRASCQVLVYARVGEHHPLSNCSQTSVAPKKVITPRRVWRMTPDAPLGTLVDFDPTATQPQDVSDGVPNRVLDPAPVTDWRASSFDLLNGVEVRDHTDTIPGELFNRLFKR